MLDHVEKIFADMKPMMKKLKKASYKVNMEAFIENHGHYFREMTEYTENASDKETAAKELAVDFTDKVYDAYVSPKKGKIDSAVQTDLNFFMIYYVFPAILLTEHDDAKLIADHLCSRWGEKFKNSKIQYTDYDSLYVSYSFAGRKVSRIGNNWRYGGYLLGTEQGTFYGRCTCKVYKVSCYPFPGACSSTEP